jgi:hypothetical protein
VLHTPPDASKTELPAPIQPFWPYPLLPAWSLNLRFSNSSARKWE